MSAELPGVVPVAENVTDLPVPPIEQDFLTVRGRKMSVKDMLTGMKALHASELFLKTGGTVRFKIDSRVVAVDSDRITTQAMDHILSCFLGRDERQRFGDRQVADVVYETDGARFRVHFACGHTGAYASIRAIGDNIHPFNALGLPESTQRRLLEMEAGLLVICGGTDAGKTVTCTSLLDFMNRTREKALLTLEDPIEYIFEDKRSIVIQREIGLHTPSFAAGVKSGLRENLDVIFVGEMRDLDTIEQVLRAAEMGHLVISTLHADDALSAVTRIIGSFPPNDQPRIRQSLAGTLSGVVFQRLLPSKSGGRTPCVETMWPNTAVRTIIRAGDLGKLGTYLGPATGGITYRECLKRLLASGTVSREVAEQEENRLRAVGN
jgi:twitching motility protein PilT